MLTVVEMQNRLISDHWCNLESSTTCLKTETLTLISVFWAPGQDQDFVLEDNITAASRSSSPSSWLSDCSDSAILRPATTKVDGRRSLATDKRRFTHPSTNRARRRVTSLIDADTLPRSWRQTIIIRKRQIIEINSIHRLINPVLEPINSYLSRDWHHRLWRTPLWLWVHSVILIHMWVRSITAVKTV